jgi:trigger factor
MQVTETLSEGLKRQYKVVLHATDLAQRLDTELDQMRNRVQLPGFRPGKVPVAHLKRIYGKSVMADVLQNAMSEANRKIVDDGGHKLAFEPAISMPESRDVIEEVIAARADLEYTVAIEVLPTFEIADLSDVTLDKPVAEVSDAEVMKVIEGFAENTRPFSPKADGEAAAKGDRLTIDFTGRIDGAEFEGGKGEGIDLVLGSGSFIPGFEDQLDGAKAGESRLVKVTFPVNYQAPGLAGKDAEFDVTVKVVSTPGDLVVNDETAKQFGMESLEALKGAVKGSLSAEHEAASRRRLKRQLLDKLDGKYAFELPPSLLDQEFNAIWSNMMAEMSAAKRTFEADGTTEEKAREEYRAIAARRVRLGLVLAEIGDKAGVKISEEDVRQGIFNRARQFPGQEKAVVEYYSKNPEALAEIRAPIFEEKVVDHLLAQVKLAERTVSREDLLRDEDDETPAAEAKAG